MIIWLMMALTVGGLVFAGVIFWALREPAERVLCLPVRENTMEYAGAALGAVRSGGLQKRCGCIILRTTTDFFIWSGRNGQTAGRGSGRNGRGHCLSQ